MCVHTHAHTRAHVHTRTPPTYVCAHTCIGTAYEKTGEHSRVMLWSLAMLISPNGWWDWGHWLPTDTGNRRRWLASSRVSRLAPAGLASLGASEGGRRKLSLSWTLSSLNVGDNQRPGWYEGPRNWERVFSPNGRCVVIRPARVLRVLVNELPRLYPRQVGEGVSYPGWEISRWLCQA